MAQARTQGRKKERGKTAPSLVLRCCHLPLVLHAKRHASSPDHQRAQERAHKRYSCVFHQTARVCCCSDSRRERKRERETAGQAPASLDSRRGPTPPSAARPALPETPFVLQERAQQRGGEEEKHTAVMVDADDKGRRGGSLAMAVFALTFFVVLLTTRCKCRAP